MAGGKLLGMSDDFLVRGFPGGRRELGDAIAGPVVAERVSSSFLNFRAYFVRRPDWNRPSAIRRPSSTALNPSRLRVFV
jgi:hypothetical protein